MKLLPKAYWACGNGGGDSDACERLLNAMGMEAPKYDILLRYSEEAGYLRKSGTHHYKPSIGAVGKKNEKVNLVVLCDRYTFSSATMLLVYVRDGGLGTIIGEPSSNQPNNYGEICNISLTNTHLYASVSHKKFIRPDADNKERMLIPDIETVPEEAYKVAVEFLNEK
ncbi:MAG: hypothetical protein IJ379_06440 [Lachnospiraceae bacterium]|nr:hypothetical protein [Lachnospiraceae bacterium]